MYCEACKQEVKDGKVCPNCGGTLAATESAATLVKTDTSEDTEETNDFVEQLTEISSTFGQFFMKHLKKPSQAKKARSKDLISSSIVIGIYSLLLALSYYFLMRSTAGIFMSVSFFEHLFFPLIGFIILFIIIIAITFAALKIDRQIVNFQLIIAQYGAYLIPFSLLLILGMLLLLIGIGSLSLLMIVVSLMGVLFMAPTFIILDYSPQKIDQIYLLIGTYLATFIAFAIFIRLALESLMSSMFGNMMGLF